MVGDGRKKGRVRVSNYWEQRASQCLCLCETTAGEATGHTYTEGHDCREPPLCA